LIKVGIYRTKGGWGDVQMVLNAIWSFKKSFPRSVVYFSCPDYFLPLAYNNPVIDLVMPLDEFYKEEFDVVLDLSSPAIQYEIKTQPKVDKNRIEIFAEKCDVRTYEEGKVVLSEDEKRFAKDFISANEIEDKKIIGIFPTSNAVVRNWDKFDELIEAINKEYDNIHFLIFNSTNIDFDPPLNSTLLINRPVREVLSLLSICNLVIGPDTGPMHSAACLKVPTIWIFTHIDGNIRTKNYKKCSVIQKKVDCESWKRDKVPCWYSIKCGERNKPPLCSRSITVDDVLLVVKKKLRSRSRIKLSKKTKGNILFRQYGTAGDVLLTTATIAGLAKKFPDFSIDYMTQPEYFDIIINNKYINAILPWNEVYVGYDMVFKPHDAILSAGWSAGTIHLRSLYAILCEVEEGDVFISPEDYPIPFDKYVVVHTTSLIQKTYRKFDEVIKNLKLPVVQIGGPTDFECIGVSLDLRGKTTYRQTAGVLKNAEYLLGVDSFPAHCASAVGTPSIIVFGNTSSRVCAPQFKSIVIDPDYTKVCPKLGPCHNGAAGCRPLCIDTITPEEVLQVVRERFPNSVK
jgi:ADP-heptose:LPS heptosyltransferase